MRIRLGVGCSLAAGLLLLATAPLATRSADDSPPLDPAAWGGDHVGRALPEFVSGDECLFCHRDKIGTTWSGNRHATTVRPAAGEPGQELLEATASSREAAGEVELVLGRRQLVRFLKRSGDYGRLDLLVTSFRPGSSSGSSGRLEDAGHPAWDEQAFGASCAGCHASGFDPQSGNFTALSLDCFTCHGDTQLDHSQDPTRVLLARRRRDEPRVVVSLCGQCHLRTGKSRSTGRPHASHFVAGDNLFRDLDVDWSDDHLASLNPADRHVLENTRDVVVRGRTDLSCLDCHEVHAQSSRKHEGLAERALCANCHEGTGAARTTKTYRVQSRVCGY